MIQGKKSIVVILLSISLLIAIYQLVVFINSIPPTDYLQACFGFVFIVLVIMWVDLDSKEQNSIYRPYDYGFLIFIFWIPYLPYYFIKTRGIKGFLILLGLVALINLGLILQWSYYLLF